MKEELMKPKSKFLKYFLTFFLGVLLTCGGVYYLKDTLIGSASTSGVCYTACENKVTINEKGIADAVKKIYDAVVIVQNYKNSSISATGTGFIYKVDEKNGYLMTNYHVVNGNTSLKVVLSNDEEVNATYLGGDQYLDIAILTIPKDKVLKVAELGTSTSSQLGDTVFTIGTPVDYEYRGTVTRGILSGKDRLVTVAISSSTSDYVMKVLQTDAAINPGNSGGPLLNVSGEVIGINSLKLVEDEIEGMGFAIPIEDVLTHITELESGKEIIRPYLGISMLNLTDTYSLYQNNINVDDKIKSGVVVVSTQSGSSVDRVLEKGDVITKINNEEIKSAAYLRYELFKYTVGEKITITYIRDSKTKTETITLKEKP